MRNILLTIFSLLTLLMPATLSAQPLPSATGPVSSQQEDSLMRIKKAAEAGDPKALTRVGSWYYTGEHGEQDYAKALQYYTKAAEKGEVAAIGNIGYLYRYGLGVPKDSVRAMNQFLESINKGNTPLLTKMTALADNGDLFACILVGKKYTGGMIRNFEKGIPYLQKAADKEDINGIRELAIALLNNHKGGAAFTLFEKGAQRDDLTCIYYCGRMLRDGGMGVYSDPQRGIEYLEEAAKRDFPAAFYQLGQAYLKGLGVDENVDTARRYFRLGAYHLNYNSAFNLAKSLTTNPADFDYAVDLFCAAVPRGHQGAFKRLFAPSDTTLTNSDFHLYLQGLGAYESGKFADAEQLFEKLDKRVPAAATMLALIDMNPDNPDGNVKKGLAALATAASSGEKKAIYYYAAYVLGSTTDPEEQKQAIELLEALAEEDFPNPRAIELLADIICTGRYGVEKDLTHAMDLYEWGLPLLSEEGATRLSTAYFGADVPGASTKAKDILASKTTLSARSLLDVIGKK